jgi:hypothetical protein
LQASPVRGLVTRFHELRMYAIELMPSLDGDLPEESHGRRQEQGAAV